MRNCILIPTYEGHRFCVNNFLHSIQQKTNKNIPVYLIISKCDISNFAYMPIKYPDIQLHILFLSDVIISVSQFEIDENNLFQQMGKPRFQSVKKLYGLLYLMWYENYDNIAIFDSEGIVIRQIDLNEMIETYVKNPFYIYSTCESRSGSLHYDIIKNTNAMLDVNYQRIWMLEYYFWIYERKILTEFANYLLRKFKCNFIEIFKRFSIVFIENIYYTFIWHCTQQSNKYNYQAIDFTHELQAMEPRKDVIQRMINYITPSKPLEDCRRYIDEGTYASYIDNFYEKFKLTIYKPYNLLSSLDFVKKHTDIKICVSETSSVIYDYYYPEFSNDTYKNSILKYCGINYIGDNTFQFVKHTEKLTPFCWVGFELKKDNHYSYTLSFETLLNKHIRQIPNHGIFVKSHYPLVLHKIPFHDYPIGQWSKHDIRINNRNDEIDLFILIFDESPEIDILIKNMMIQPVSNGE